MRLTDASVAIRPRSAWEALDLGILLARRHAGLLMGSWALVSLPVFLLLSALLWEYPGWAVLLFWWLKPAFDRLPLHILSRALFSDTPTLGQTMRAFPGLLKPQLIASLLWRRLSPTRSFDLPVLQLEGLKGQPRRQRLAVLRQRNAGGASWLTIVGMHFELALWLGLMALFYLLLPQQWLSDWKWQTLIRAAQGDWLWLEHLTNLLYALVLVVWEPVYVACGFTLYLNRRTELEAWDIELVFRRLRQRLVGTAYALLLLIAGCITVLPSAPTWAADSPGQSSPAVTTDPEGPDAPRLLGQKLNSEQSRKAVKDILAAAPFRNSETITRWRLGEDRSADKSKGAKDSALKSYLEALQYWPPFRFITQFIEVLLWATLFSLVALLAWRYREWLRVFAGRGGENGRAGREAPRVMFGLELAPDSLPDDVASEAERLWESQPRVALGLLYRALLSRLVHDFHLPLRDSYTEGEVLEQVRVLDSPELNRYAQTLTGHWQTLAYGHASPAESIKVALCGGWRELFGNEVRP